MHAKRVGDLLLHVIPRGIGRQHARFRVIERVSVEFQRLRQGPALHAWDFAVRTGIVRQARLHARDEFIAAKVDLPAQVLSDAGAAHALLNELDITRDLA